MDLVQLTEEIVKSLVVDQDAVSVKEFPTEEENVILIQVIVAESDIGRVIGKGGRCANAIVLESNFAFFFFCLGI